MTIVYAVRCRECQPDMVVRYFGSPIDRDNWTMAHFMTEHPLQQQQVFLWEEERDE